MGREKMLLERIAESGGRSRVRREPTASEDLDALMESVRVQLGRLLNARQGMSEALPDYGLPALTDVIHGTQDYALAMQEAIRLTIERYEPRLRRVRVSRVMDEEQAHTLAFRVDAVLISQTGDHRVWYQTEVTGAGEFDVTD